MTTNNDDLVKQLIEAENSHDIEKLIALVTDDVVIEDVPFVCMLDKIRFREFPPRQICRQQ